MTNNNPASVAVIMPVYNAAPYVEASVRSVLNQSYGDILLIAVNDGSTDESISILQRLAAEDGRLRVLDIENGGPARARNIALDAVPEGTEYIMFADADDLLSPDAVEYAITEGSGAELVLMGFRIDNTDGSHSEYREPYEELNRDKLGGALGRLYKANLLNQVWAKLFRAELIKKAEARFPDYRWGEDRLFVFDCLEAAESVKVLPRCKYGYQMHPGDSLISSYYPKKFQVCLEVDRRVQGLCQSLGIEGDGDFRYMFVKSVFSCLTTLFSKSCPLSGREKREELRRIIRNEQLRQRSRHTFGGIAVKALCAVIRSGSVWLNYVCFFLVAKAGSLAPRLFTRLKHRK